MKTSEQIRAIDRELRVRLNLMSEPGKIPDSTIRDLALDIHQSLADSAEGGIEMGVYALTGQPSGKA